MRVEGAESRLRGMLSRNNTCLCGITEFGKELLAIFPGKAECANVSDTESSHCVADRGEPGGIELTCHQC